MDLETCKKLEQTLTLAKSRGEPVAPIFKAFNTTDGIYYTARKKYGLSGKRGGSVKKTFKKRVEASASFIALHPSNHSDITIKLPNGYTISVTSAEQLKTVLQALKE